MWYKASAPGSLMLMGEYAVLHDGHALVAAIDKRVTITLIPRSDKKIFTSSALGKYSSDLSNLTIEAPFQFVLTAIKQFLNKFTTGFELEIESEFLHTVGLGSSAAVTTAMIAVLAAWLNQDMTQEKIIDSARAVIQSVQGLGSGADAAASVMGGVVAYRKDPLLAETLSESISLAVVYSGHKTPTVEAVNQVNRSFSNNPQRFKDICHKINDGVILGITHLKQKNWRALGAVMNQQQCLMDALGVSTPALTDIVDTLRRQPEIFGAKISGSGLGDCAIGLGVINESLIFDNPAIQVLTVNVAAEGVVCHSP